jgi:transcriptional regulator of acetoin/glycerol metabolism
LDYQERDGFAIGKAAALQEWAFRKEKKEFKRLLARVRRAQSYKRWRQQGLCGFCGEAPVRSGMCARHADAHARRRTRMRRRRGVPERQPSLLTFQGETLRVAAWAKRAGIPRKTLYHRLRVGWSVERALTTPPGPSRCAATPTVEEPVS